VDTFIFRGAALHLTHHTSFSAGAARSLLGDTQQETANETTAFSIQKPLAVRQKHSFWQVAKLFVRPMVFSAGTVITCHHESPLSLYRFVTQKSLKEYEASSGEIGHELKTRPT